MAQHSLIHLVSDRGVHLAAMAAMICATLWSMPLNAQQPPRPAVVVAPAEMSDLRDSIRFSGRLVAVQKIELRARVSGFLQEIAFTEGAVVEQGAPLYTIEAEPYEAIVTQIEGSIAATEAELALAEIERRRKRQLVERNTVAQSELDIAIANVGKVEGEITRLKGELARAKLDVSYTKISAPFDGVVGLSSFDVGAFVGPDSGALAKLIRLDPMTVEFPIPSALFLDYREARARGERTGNSEVSLLLPNGSSYPTIGEVDFVDAEVARGTDTVIVRAVFANPDSVLLDGGLVTVQLVSSEPQIVLNIPQQAVQRDLAGDFVLVVNAQDTVEQRRVSIGRTSKGRSVVTQGLEEGDLVITEGINKVRPGIEVDAASGTDG